MAWQSSVFTRLDQGFSPRLLVLRTLSGRSAKEVVGKRDLVIFAKRRTVRRICNRLLEQDLCESFNNVLQLAGIVKWTVFKETIWKFEK